METFETINLNLHDNSNIKKIILKVGTNRKYQTKIYDGKNLFDQIYSYPEVDFIQYEFDDGFVCSGSKEHGLWGIISNSNYYCSDFSKRAAAFTRDSFFWDLLSSNFQFNKIDEIIRFDTPINVLFSIQQYWHWFCEDLPIIEGFRLNTYPIIINKLKNWQKESLEFFPDILERIIEVDTPCCVVAPKYFTYKYPATSLRGKANKWVVDFLQKNLSSNAKQNKNKIYISRGDAAARVVENEDEIKQFLSRNGFICYDNFSNLSLQEKINIFKNASVVISPTGAGLTHVHAVDPGTIIIDFNHAFELAEECGWNNIGTAVDARWYTFAAITGADTERSKARGIKAKNKNLIVDNNVLKRVLEIALG